MPESRRVRQKQRITYTASEEGVKKADNALMRLGFESKSNFAQSQILSRTTVTKFFNRQPIQLDSFKRICDALKLSNWKEIAELPEEKELDPLKTTDYSNSAINKEVEMEMTDRRQVIVIDKESKKIKAQIILEGDINSINNNLSLTLELCLRKYPGDSIRVTDIQEGSIKLIIEGSQEDIERLVERIQSGELKEVNGFPVEDIQILGESSDDENDESSYKWRLVQEIINQGAKGRNLSGVDLSDADLGRANLSGATLSDADLSGADLSRAKLSGADLSGADLSGAYFSGIDPHSTRDDPSPIVNLSGANLSGADLSDANLSGVDLSGADLSDADLSGAYLRDIIIDSSTKFDNKWRLVWEIVNQPDEKRNLSRANLSDAYLSDAYLSDADLSRADLSHAKLWNADLNRANLNRANLSHAYLVRAKLWNANFIEADLSHANFIEANLSGANLSGANVENTQFGYNEGISEEMRDDLIRRGAIFEDIPGDRSPVFSPR